MARQPRLNERTAGILLHATSLPGRHGVGDLGAAAREFVDFLAEAGMTWWQMLPIGPPGPGHSPYSALSAFAGSPLLISLDSLADEGLLAPRDLAPVRGLPAQRVAYPAVTRFKVARLRRAFAAFASAGGRESRGFARFCAANAHWLEDHALYSALRRRHGADWTRWPSGLRRRHRADLARRTEALARDVEYERFVQYVFERQWSDLHARCRARRIGLIGDLPIFVAHDSSDVWAHQELFDLDARGRARTVSGVPPDYFSRTGQRWGHPHYRWARHARTGFAWWLARCARTFAQVDAVRIDHFLGFNRVWAVPGRAKTARHGRWVKTPGEKLFAALRRSLGPLEIIAEDLGLVVREAVALRERFGFPGMRLLHFAFGNDEGDRYNQPHTYPRRCVVYPGTHDNETTVGWFRSLRAADRAARGRRGGEPLAPYRRVLRYTGTDGREIHWDIVRLALQSVANTAIVPLQDLLGLDNRARMNTPATTRGNWEWRCRRQELTPALARRVRELVDAYGRR